MRMSPFAERLPIILLTLLFAWNTRAEQLGARTHWLANTGGKAEDHIANFLTDMVVWYPNQAQYPSPLVLTASFWDEGSCGYCSYHEGKQVGKAEWWKDTIHSDRAHWNGKTCTIGNFWGRAFLHRNAPPPKGDSAPFVACDGSDTIRWITDPTALAFDMDGNLLVADNGPDQDVKILSFEGNSTRLLRTFGDSGGVFAGPIPGAAGIRRFWGIRGLGVDSSGNVYVGNTGIPEQTMGGTDIRVFSGSDSSLLWQVQGLSFVNSAETDPASQGASVFLNAKRFRMDWEKDPGSSWTLQAATLDPFRHPGDPRIETPMESVFMRRIHGRLFQFSTNMSVGFLAVHRFEEGSEIGIPTAMFTLTNPNLAWMADSAPPFERSESNKRLRWYWIDSDGDGIPTASEFDTFELANIYSMSLAVGEDGHIWLGGGGAWSRQFRGGGLQEIPLTGLDAKGVPRWRMDSIVHHDLPVPSDSGAAGRLVRLSSMDAMFVAYTDNYYIRQIRRYDHWSDPASRREAFAIDLGYDDKGVVDIRLDVNTADLVLPMSFAADSDIVVVGYLDRGRDARVRGELTVYDARDGHRIGWILPGEEVGGRAGAIDLPYALSISSTPDGMKTILAEEDGFGKVLAYRWCPQGASCASAGPEKVEPAGRTSSTWSLDRNGALRVQAPRGSWISVRDFAGRNLWSGRIPDRRPLLLPPPSSTRWGSVILAIREPSGRTTVAKCVAP